MSRGLKSGLLLLFCLAPVLLGMSGSAPTSAQYAFTRASSPHVESVLGWMVTSAISKLFQAVTIGEASPGQAREYFLLAGRYRIASQAGETGLTGPAKLASLPADLSHLRTELDAAEPAVEQLLQAQISAAIAEAGLGVGVLGLPAPFPPVVFKFQPPPKLLVISHRDRIDRVATVLVDPRMTPAEIERLEIDAAGDEYSSLVTSIGGLGVYPSMMPESADVRWTLRTIAHEWTHQYLSLRPLGWQYAFGAERDGRMITVNETVSDIVGREVGDTVYARSYRDGDSRSDGTLSRDAGVLRRTLRDLRTSVDALLASGKLDEAESLMEQTRERLASDGYYIRKLNQAYFAFHGSYADDPYVAGPQGEDIAGRLHALRAESGTIGEFLSKVSGVGSYEELSAIAPRP